MVGLTGGAFAEEQRWRDRREPDGAYPQGYNREWNHNRYYHRSEGDREDHGRWPQSRHRDYRAQFRRDGDDRGRQ